MSPEQNKEGSEPFPGKRGVRAEKGERKGVRALFPRQPLGGNRRSGKRALTPFFVSPLLVAGWIGAAAQAPDEGERAAVSALEPAVDVGAATRPAVAPSATPGAALDTLDLGTTSITGNQELPKVLYIVPWKRSDLGDLVGRPVNTLLDEVLAPIDPEVFGRHLEYYEVLYGGGERDAQTGEE